MLNIQINASQIANLTDARYFAAMGVEWMEFNMSPGSESYIEPIKLTGIKEWVEGPEFIIAFGIQNSDQILELAQQVGLNSIEVPFFFDQSKLPKLNSLKVTQEVIVDKNQQEELISFIENRLDLVDSIHVDFAKNGFSWLDIVAGHASLSLEDLHSIQKRKPLIISIANLLPTQIEEINKNFKQIGIKLQGGSEEKVGFKSYDELDEIFDALEAID